MKMAITKFSSELFTYNAATKCATAFDSDLRRPTDLQVWDDACDVGFEMVSTKTGKAVVFTLTDTHVVDGDIQYWEFASFGLEHQMKAMVFND